MYFFVARQPILDKDKKLVAYELLFRDGVENVFPIKTSLDLATSRVIDSSYFNGWISDFLGDKPGFINFTLDTLVNKYPSLLPPEQIVVEILEALEPDLNLLEECKILKQQGYRLALDDYRHHPDWILFYPFIDIIKVDLRVTQRAEISIIKEAIKPYPHIKLLAEKVETIEEFNQALTDGFDYFQGYFFAKPELMQSRALLPVQATILELLAEMVKPDVDINKVVRSFERDVSLSYRLMRYANSALFKRVKAIESIRQAVVSLGEIEIQKFLSLLFVSQLNMTKPDMLIKLSMIRAKFMENLAGLHNKVSYETAFLVGMFSLLDAILDKPMSEIVKQLPLADDIKLALSERKGFLADYLKLIECYEKGEWIEINDSIISLGIEGQSLPELYMKAMQWAEQQAIVFGR